MSKEPIEYLRHIADECIFLLSQSDTLSKDDFYNNYVKKQKPVVIEKLTEDWPAYSKWNFEYIKQVAGEQSAERAADDDCLGHDESARSVSWTPCRRVDAPPRGFEPTTTWQRLLRRAFRPGPTRGTAISSRCARLGVRWAGRAQACALSSREG